MAGRGSWLNLVGLIARPSLESWSTGSRLGLVARALESGADIVEEDVNDRGGVKREHLAEQEAADHGDAQRTAELGADAAAKGERNAAQQRGHGGHHDRPETQQAGFVNGVSRALAVFTLRLKGEVDHHDAVLFHDADEQDDADDRDDAEVLAEDHRREERTDTGRG